jgi:DNA-directed RNA polymerase subunit M/transcription elongation factor TFIIS
MQTLKNCPICNQQEAKKYLEVKDNSVSKETFTIEECESCGFKFTNPRPDVTEIG